MNNGGRVGFCTNVAVGAKRFILNDCGSGALHVKRILQSFSEITDRKRRDYSFCALLKNKAPELDAKTDIYILTTYTGGELSEIVRELETACRSVCVVCFGAGGVA